MTAMNASTGTLTSSWPWEWIPSPPSRTKMVLALTISAGEEEKLMVCIEIAENVQKKTLKHRLCVIQKPGWRKDALVFLKKRPQAVLELL